MDQISLPPSPNFGDQLNSSHKSDETIYLLLNRRSTTAKLMQEPGPDAEQLGIILQAGARVPDHGKLAPWRFLLVTEDHRHSLGERFAEIAKKNVPDLSNADLVLERGRFLRAPIVIVVISKILQHHKIPVWEQQLSAGAVCQNMLIAANALGFASQWLTEWYSYDDDAKAVLGLTAEEQVAGFVYIGTTTDTVMERKRTDLNELVSLWTPATPHD